MTGSLFFSVGEPSGDLHSAKLLEHISRAHPALPIRGFGGQKMVRAGLQCDFDLTQLAVVGISEVIPKLREFYRVADIASAAFATGDVSAVVLVDNPGFNWHIAKRAKAHGIPVLYYLPPQLWAWGGWRIHKLRRTVDKVLTGLPFEDAFYSQERIATEYVGHPFFDEVAEHQLDQRMMSRTMKSNNETLVGVLPGSRQREVRTIWTMQLETIRRLHREHPKTRFLIASFKDSHAVWCREQMSEDDKQLPIEFYVGKTSEIIELADCVLSKSGSVTLELMARGKPTTVIYQVQPLTFVVGRILIRCNTITLPNMIAGEKVMAEFLCVTRREKAIRQLTTEMSRLIGDLDYRTQRRNRLLEMSDQYARPGASRNAADAICRFVDERTDAISNGNRRAIQAA
jgi:lipid-A-disaccharide synthase